MFGGIELAFDVMTGPLIANAELVDWNEKWRVAARRNERSQKNREDPMFLVKLVVDDEKAKVSTPSGV